MADLLPLTPPGGFHILVALADGERHGYGIMQDVAQQTNVFWGSLQLGPGTLYGCLKRMLASGLVEESDERLDPELDDARRRYYRITTLGKRTVRAEAGKAGGRGDGCAGSEACWREERRDGQLDLLDAALFGRCCMPTRSNFGLSMAVK